jgi:hypothetical protein
MPYQREKSFVDGRFIIFSVFFCLEMFHEPQTEAFVPKAWVDDFHFISNNEKKKGCNLLKKMNI